MLQLRSITHLISRESTQPNDAPTIRYKPFDKIPDPITYAFI